MNSKGGLSSNPSLCVGVELNSRNLPAHVACQTFVYPAFSLRIMVLFSFLCCARRKKIMGLETAMDLDSLDFLTIMAISTTFQLNDVDIIKNSFSNIEIN